MLNEINPDLRDAIINYDAKAESVTVRKNNVIHIDKAIDEQLGFVGDPKKIDTKILNNFFKQKIIPVIAPMGEIRNHMPAEMRPSVQPADRSHHRDKEPHPRAGHKEMRPIQHRQLGNARRQAYSDRLRSKRIHKHPIQIGMDENKKKELYSDIEVAVVAVIGLGITSPGDQSSHWSVTTT